MRCIYLFALAMVLACQSLGAARADIYVSAQGSDSNNCGLASAPCASLYQAVRNFGSSGTDGLIRCLTPLASSGAPQTITISISLTIDCRGSYASLERGNISGFDTAFVINGAGINVTLRGINIYSDTGTVGVAPVAIDIQQAASVTIEDCRIDNMTSQGVYDHRSTAGKLLIKDTVIRRVSSGPGIAVAGAARNSALIDNVTLDSNQDGIDIADYNEVTIIRSNLSNNVTNGVSASGNAFVAVNASTISSNATGVASNYSIRLSNNDIAFNQRAIGGVAGTFGNNRFSGNIIMGTTPTPLGNASSDLGQQ